MGVLYNFSHGILTESFMRQYYHQMKKFYLFNLLFFYLIVSGLSCGTWGPHRVMWDLALWHTGCLVVAHRLHSMHVSAVAARRLSFSTACDVSVSPPGIKSMSPSFTIQILNTGTPGRSQVIKF